MFETSIRAKVLVPVVTCMVAAMAVAFVIVNHRITEQSETEARHALATANAVIRYSQEYRRDNLLLRFHNLPNEPLWRQVFQPGGGKNLHETLRELMAMQKVDVVLYASNKGKLLASEQGDPMISVAAFEAAAQPAIQAALQGGEISDTVRVGNKLYDVVVVPTYSKDQKQTGVLTLGLELGGTAAQELSRLTQSQIALLAGGHVIASTLPGVDASALCISAFESATRSTGTNNPGPDVKAVLLNGVHYYCAAGRFPSLQGDDTLGYVLLNSQEQSLAATRATQWVLLVVIFCAVLLCAQVVWFCVNLVTSPLRELRHSAEAVGRGDFTRRVPVRNRDECGELASVFNQMTENLQQSRAELETTQAQLLQSDKLSAVGEFVAGVAHELNNPLTAVIGYSEMLKMADLGENYRHHSEMIFKSAQRCQRIVQQLLSFARPQKPERKPVSLNTLVMAVLEIVSYTLRTSNIEIVTQLDPKLPLVMADAMQIQQVLLNVLNNAYQAIEGHGRPGGRIKITTETAGSKARILIQDNGPGIPAEVLPRIFNPFFTTKGVGKGTGLGLSLCYGIIKEHGGSITPVSRYGEGATFIIELPVSEMPRDVAAAPNPPERGLSNPREGAGRRVLVIDDEEPILNLLREHLVKCGYEVKVAVRGEAGLNELKQNPFDVTFCDWKMPGLNGRQVYETLRHTNPRLCRRMIFITGDVINEPMRQFLETEKLPCLTKPFALPELRAAIQTVLETK